MATNVLTTCAEYSHPQSHVSLNLTLTTVSAQVVETAVKSPSQGSSHPDDHFQSRYVTPRFKPFSQDKKLSFPFGLGVLFCDSLDTRRKLKKYKKLLEAFCILSKHVNLLPRLLPHAPSLGHRKFICSFIRQIQQIWHNIAKAQSPHKKRKVC